MLHEFSGYYYLVYYSSKLRSFEYFAKIYARLAELLTGYRTEPEPAP